MNEFTNLSLTEINKQIDANIAISTSGVLIWSIVSFAVLTCLSISIFIILYIKNSDFAKLMCTAGATILLGIICGMSIYKIVEAEKNIALLNEAKIKLSEEAVVSEGDYLFSFSEKEVQYLKIDSISNRAKVEDKLCPNKSSFDTCYFIEYKKDGQIGQAIVPFNKGKIDKAGDPLTLVYYNIPKDEVVEYIERFNLANKDFDGEKINSDVFLLGDSLTK